MHLSINTKFLSEIKKLVNSAKQRVVTSINIAMVYTYYEIGRRIVEQEQKGANRAEYGKELLKQLSAILTKEFGRGYSSDNLNLFHKFYLVYSRDNNNHLAIEQPIKNLESNRERQILETVFTKSKINNNFKNDSLSCNKVKQKRETVFLQPKIINNFKNYPRTYDGYRFFLNWASYILLIRIVLPTKEELISLLKDGD